MAISNQSMQLSQDLMDLQSRYNALNIEKNRITSELRIKKEEILALEESNKFLKSRLKDREAQTKATRSKTDAIKKQCEKGCFLN